MTRARTILIVEDEAIVRNMMVTVLVRKDYRVLEAASAGEALEVSNVFEGVIDLLIADHSLKMMTGRQVVEKICGSRADLKILHISGYPLANLEQEGGIIPGADFLAKPFLPGVLIEKVKGILDGPG
jgi:DNA-binding response OmpR family regulator